MNVELTEDQQNYIQEQLDSGIHANAKDVLLEALSHKMAQDAEEQAKIEAFQAAITEGLESGESTPLDMDSIIKEAKQEALRNAHA